jgi:biopolymer transport protein ExbB
MIDLFVKGGPLMWPLLLCSLISLTVTVERIIFWVRESSRRNPELIADIFRKAESGDFDGATHAGSGAVDVETQALLSGLEQRSHGLPEALGMAAQDGIDRAKRGMNILNTIITVAPLLGILGTVLGIINSFNVLSLEGIQNPKEATGGVAQALITTAAGLSVAIVTLIPFNFFVSRIQRLTKHLDQLITSFEVACRKGGAGANGRGGGDATD